MKNITILGGAGYIGSHLVKMLLDKNYYVKVLDIGFFGFDHLPKSEKLEIFQGDIRHAEDLSKSIKGSDAVIHLAGLVGDPACKVNPTETWLHNIESSEMIADVCNYYNIEKFIFASSCSVYGYAPEDIVLNEGSYLSPLSLYAKSKIDSEKIFTQKIKNIYSTLRLSTVFGFSDRMRFDLVANLFTMQGLYEKKIKIFGGKQYRPFVHCEDVASAFMLTLHTEKEYIDREVFNISNQNISIMELGKMISKILDVDYEVIKTKEDDRNYLVSSEKAKWLLKFNPKYDLELGIKNMVREINKRDFSLWKNNPKYSNIDNFVKTFKQTGE